MQYLGNRLGHATRELVCAPDVLGALQEGAIPADQGGLARLARLARLALTLGAGEVHR
jgi:hypothetical protein